MALDLSGGSGGARPGSRILLWCPEAADRPRVAGLELWRRAVYTACRAGFTRLVLVAPERVRAALAGDPRLEGRSWEVVDPDGWASVLVGAGARWVVLCEDWVVDADLLAALAATEGGPAAATADGPFAADAETLIRRAAAGWTPADGPPGEVATAIAPPLVYRRVASDVDAAAAEDLLFGSLARNVTNVFARTVDRAMSRALSRRLAPFPVTPNQITVFSTLLGIAGALVMLDPSWAAGAIGAFLFFAHTVIDGCDGEIARLKFQESASGAKLDLIGDNVVHAFLFPCMAARFYFADPQGPFLWLGLLALTGVVVTWVTVYWLIVKNEPGGLRLKVFETFANREFAYLLLVLGLAGKLEWFVWAMAFGLWAFPAVLVAAWVIEGRSSHA